MTACHGVLLYNDKPVETSQLDVNPEKLGEKKKKVYQLVFLIIHTGALSFQSFTSTSVRHLVFTMRTARISKGTDRFSSLYSLKYLSLEYF